MKVLLPIISFFLLSCTGKAQVLLTKKIDPDIVIINFEEGDRAFIGNLINKVDSCSPTVIGIDARFTQEKDNYQDSILQRALSLTNKDIIAYFYDDSGLVIKPIERFDTLTTIGLAVSFEEKGLATYFIPLTISTKGIIHEHFALQVAKKWMPNFRFQYNVNEKIPIQFQRKMEQYRIFNGSELNYTEHAKFLKNKIVLLGYTGPSNEDKHFTPIRLVEEYPNNEPDTYGVIILANEIRTILNQTKISKK